jgi:hypothetical protein
MTNSEYYKAAKALFDAGIIFQKETNISAHKASEVLIASVTNTWFQEHHGAAHIRLETGATGIDGLLSYDAQPASVNHAVEIKSSKGKQFLFGRHFLPKYSVHHEADDGECAFDKHMMVIMGQINKDTNTLTCLYIAHGRNVMNELSKELDKDTKRKSYKPDNRGELRIFTENQKEGGRSGRKEECIGLNKLSEKFEYKSSGTDFQNADWIKVLKGDELKAIIKKLDTSN